MKIIYLIPPSEGKNKGGTYESEQLSFIFEKPSDIAQNANPKDLHCKGSRYEEAIKLNHALIAQTSDYTPAIQRYSGVMYNAIDYNNMSSNARKYFKENFLVVSGMYGLVSPNDIIGNYKLPISAKGLYKFWGNNITKALMKIKPDLVVNLLPQAYMKTIDFHSLETQVVHVAFMRYKDDTLVNMAHGVKKVKGEWIKKVCGKRLTHYNQFDGDMIEKDREITIQIIQK